MNIRKVRDLTLISVDDRKTMVIACDSCGSIGNKEGDALKVPPFITGKFTARVALFEVMGTGAQVVCLTNTVCNEMEPTGREIIKGIEEELRSAGLDNVVLTGSTEENFPTIATGIGITVMGLADNAALKINNVKQEALVVAIGMPKVGYEVLTCRPGDIADYRTIKLLLATDGVREIVPVGSKGIGYEAQQLAQSNQLDLIINENTKLDLKKSAGPCTVIIAAVEKDIMKKISNISNVEIIGKLTQRS
ncbi:hypothetical protein SCACP_40330 [Sporomusa carbonis]|uniref:AIR synthase related protein n=1 Tax=Sporomusa carbonis TaxID=3076075 RepID=UPI003A73F4B2